MDAPPTVNTDRPGPIVSLLVCTFNRAKVLGQTLESLLRQEFGWGEFEILVVDNASTDDTREVAEQYSRRDPRVRYLHEPRLGVAIARNTGAREAQAPYIAYFDDDLVAEPDCLHRLMAPFWEVRPAPAAVMGRAELLWHGARPAWFPQKYETLLSRFDRGPDARFLNAGDYLITMNVAFHRETFLATGGIREDLSRKGRMFICSGDNELFSRYLDRQLPVFYQPAALIWHLVPPSRQTRRWLLKRTLGEGTSQVIAKYAGASRRSLFRRTLYDCKVAMGLCWETAKAYLAGRRGTWKDSFFALVEQLGRVSAEFQLLAGVRSVRTLSE
jgi:glycosyltransferase involved in cell wall biosynthesis